MLFENIKGLAVNTSGNSSFQLFLYNKYYEDQDQTPVL